MFKNAFSFDGRIRRTEYGISFIIYFIIAVVINISITLSSENSDDLSQSVLALVGYIPVLWFVWAQGAKRCHDLGKTGWFQIIPFYVFWLMFVEGAPGPNKYGIDPKDRQDEIQGSTN